VEPVLQGSDAILQPRDQNLEGPVLGLKFFNPALQLSGVWFHPLVLEYEHAGAGKDSSEMRVKYWKGGRFVTASRN
jgi:hypothetical protein